MAKTVEDLRRDYPHHITLPLSRLLARKVEETHDRFGGASWCEKRGSRTFGFESAIMAEAFRTYWESI